MVSNRATLFCVLLISEFVLAQAGTRTFKLTGDIGCDVFTAVEMDFDVTSITPSAQCEKTKTVCMNVYTSVTLTGTFTDRTILTIYGLNNNTAQIPVIVSADILTNFYPQVGRFPGDGFLSFANALKFELLSGGHGDSTYTGCTKATTGNEENCDTKALCCLVTEHNLKLWGTVGSEKFVKLSKIGENTVYIPLLVKAETDMDPTPLMLITSTATLSSPKNFMVPFIAEGVKEGTAELKPPSGGGCTGSCFQISKSPLTAIFSGKVPAQPVTYTIGNNQNKIIYTLGSAGSS